MSGEIINLNKVRKAKAKADKQARAAENRVRFGRTKAQRLSEAEEKARRSREIEGARRTPPVDVTAEKERSGAAIGDMDRGVGDDGRSGLGDDK